VIEASRENASQARVRTPCALAPPPKPAVWNEPFCAIASIQCRGGKAWAGQSRIGLLATSPGATVSNREVDSNAIALGLAGDFSWA